MNPISGLLHSRKFWVAVADLTVTLTLYFVGKYAPAYADDVKIVIAAIQPVFLVLIGSIAYEDGAAKRAGNHASQVENHSMEG